ncbi:MAG: polysaccharide pyruvyl transferase family protein [Clostridiales bacterium]|nr:polysaccharide pyruvyl transferase family protein [Clostridiales bacterium]
MKTIYVHGSFESNNFGDFLLYKLALEAIKNFSAMNKAEVRILSDSVSKMYKELYPIETMSVFKAIKVCDAVVFVGGGYLGEPGKNIKNWNKHFYKAHALPLLLSSLKKKKTAIIGVGAGPVSNKFIRFAIDKSIKNASVISVRDIESKEFLLSLNKDIEVSVHPDWVLSSSFDSFIDFSSCNEENRMFIHVTGNNLDQVDILIASLCKLREHYNNLRFTVGTDNTQVKQYDIAKYIFGKIGNEFDKLYLYDDPNQLIMELSKCRYIITDKLHVGICGIRMGKHVLSLPIHPKIYRFYNQIAYNSNYVIPFDKISADKLPDQLTGFIENCETIEIENIIKDSDKNIELLYDFLSAL